MIAGSYCTVLTSEGMQWGIYLGVQGNGHNVKILGGGVGCFAKVVMPVVERLIKGDIALITFVDSTQAIHDIQGEITQTDEKRVKAWDGKKTFDLERKALLAVKVIKRGGQDGTV